MGAYPPGCTQADFDREADRLGQQGDPVEPREKADPGAMDKLRATLERTRKPAAVKEAPIATVA